MRSPFGRPIVSLASWRWSRAAVSEGHSRLCTGQLWPRPHISLLDRADHLCPRSLGQQLECGDRPSMAASQTPTSGRRPSMAASQTPNGGQRPSMAASQTPAGMRRLFMSTFPKASAIPALQRRRNSSAPEQLPATATNLPRNTLATSLGPMHSRRASVMSSMQGIERMKANCRLSVAEKKEQYNEQRVQEKQVELNKLNENWARVFNGAETQSRNFLAYLFSFGAFAALAKAFVGEEFEQNPRGCGLNSGRDTPLAIF